MKNTLDGGRAAIVRLLLASILLAGLRHETVDSSDFEASGESKCRVPNGHF